MRSPAVPVARHSKYETCHPRRGRAGWRMDATVVKEHDANLTWLADSCRGPRGQQLDAGIGGMRGVAIEGDHGVPYP